ncbi:MAG: hypothetical protein O9972_28825 [Burkholderiales bacterium]|nr:hypothetical protein [Burkholderiales bacterium]
MRRNKPSTDRIPASRDIVTRSQAKPLPKADSDSHPALGALARLLARQIATDLSEATRPATRSHDRKEAE